MKRTILFVCVFALLCALLCGCGSYRDGETATVTPAVTAELIPETSPMISMDPNAGEVKDGDGVIGNENGVTISPAPSASPAASAKPSASAKP